VTDTTAVDVDALLAEIFLTPAGKSNPYPRRGDPQHSPAFRSGMGFVVVGRYEDCQLCCAMRAGKGDGPCGGLRADGSGAERAFPISSSAPLMLGLDPPDHTRLRRLVAKAFTPKTVENLRPDIVRLTDELLDRFSGEVDVIPELECRCRWP
jgi:cytochrome P450